MSLLDKYEYQTVDLEGYACHRGSTFGGLGMKEQPSNEQFENNIAEKLNSFKQNRLLYQYFIKLKNHKHIQNNEF